MTVYDRNFKALEEMGIVDQLKKHGYIKMNSRGLMDLSVNKLCEDQQKIIFSLAHYGEQNGEAMADPDMELLLMKEAKEVQALSYRNDYAGFYQEVNDNYENPSPYSVYNIYYIHVHISYFMSLETGAGIFRIADSPENAAAF